MIPSNCTHDMLNRRNIFFGAALSVAALALAACSSNGHASSVSPLPAAPDAAHGATNTPGPGAHIKHIVVIVQENRTLSNIFEGFPHANTVPCGTNSKGKQVCLTQIKFSPDQDMVHNYTQAVTAWNNGKMNQFDLTPFDSGIPNGNYAYSFLERSEVQPYWTMAETYTLADHMFPMEFGPSFTSHLALIAGNDNLSPGVAEVNYPFGEPWGCDSHGGGSFTVNTKREVQENGPSPCFTQFRTMADNLDAAKVSWKYYAPAISGYNGGQLWTSFDAIKSVRYGPDWKNIINPQTTVLTDAAQGKLASVSWVIPDWQDSDHPAASSDTGPSWVSSVVNAIGEGPEWNSTAIVLIWDDWGGWFDPLPPPQHDFRGNGMRVGMVIISPYAKKAYVDHTVYESGSILHFMEETFGLAALGPESAGYTDQRGASLDNAFDFTQAPRPFRFIPSKYKAPFFLHRPPSLHVVDEE